MAESDQVIIVLDRPAHPGNIGAAARAMKNMGLTRLRLVEPRQFPDPAAYEYASQAANLLDQAEIFPSLANAVDDLDFLVATTNRPRGQRQKIVTPRELGAALPTILAQPHTRAGILFGTERTGLLTQDIERADWLCNIPTAGTFGSLNLAQSVLLVGYEIMLGNGPGHHFAMDPAADNTRAPAKDLDRFFQHLQEVLFAIDFIKDQRNRHLMGSLKALFHRASLDQREINILRGILSEVTRATQTKPPGNPP